MSSRRNKNIQPDEDNYSYNANNRNNMNPGGGANMNPGGGMNMNNLGQMLNNMDLGQIMGQLSQMMGGPPGGSTDGQQAGFQPPRPSPPRDPRFQLLQAMKPFLGKRRGVMIDNIGNLYNIAKLVRGFNKRR